jgi:hypothetical protein
MSWVLRPAAVSGWRDQFLAGGEANLKARETDTKNEETRRLKSLVADLNMSQELLREKIHRLEAGRHFGLAEVETMSRAVSPSRDGSMAWSSSVEDPRPHGWMRSRWREPCCGASGSGTGGNRKRWGRMRATRRESPAHARRGFRREAARAISADRVTASGPEGEARRRMLRRMKTLGYRISQKARKKAEQVFGCPWKIRQIAYLWAAA